eukprot:3870945-Lingulodinium_polyedra.AAC.1
MGVLLHQTGAATPVLRYAASQAFWTMPKHQLEKLAKDEGLDCRGLALHDLVKALVLKVLGPLTPPQLAQIMKLRASTAPPQLPPQ